MISQRPGLSLRANKSPPGLPRACRVTNALRRETSPALPQGRCIQRPRREDDPNHLRSGSPSTWADLRTTSSIRPGTAAGGRSLHIRSGELRQPDSAEFFAKGLHARAPVQGHGPRRQPIHPMSQPVLQRVTHGVAPPRPQPALHLLVQVPQLVPDLGLGPPGDLLADARSGRAEAEADSPDVPGSWTHPSRSSPRLARGGCAQHPKPLSWEPLDGGWLPFWLPGHHAEGPR